MTWPKTLDSPLRHPLIDYDQEGCPIPQTLRIDPRYHQIRDSVGVAEIQLHVPLPDGRSAWLVTRPSDFEEVFRDTATFSREPVASLPGFIPFDKMLPGMEGGEHAAIRGLASDYFKPAIIGGYRENAAAYAIAGARKIARSAVPLDLFKNFALPLALNVASDLIGVPAEARMRFAEWGDDFLSTDNARKEAGARAMFMYVSQLIELRRSKPEDDLLSHIVARAPENLDQRTLVNLPITILLAGWETTARMAVSIPFLLLTSVYKGCSSAYRYLVDHPEDIPGAVNEGLRMCPISTHDGLPRQVLRDTVLSGQQLRAGDVAIPSHDAVNHDPTRFSDPELLDFTRTNMHYTFGRGPHHCLGRRLAELELVEGLKALTGFCPDLVLAEDPSMIEWLQGSAIRGPKRLMVARSHDAGFRRHPTRRDDQVGGAEDRSVSGGILEPDTDAGPAALRRVRCERHLPG